MIFIIGKHVLVFNLCLYFVENVDFRQFVVDFAKTHYSSLPSVLLLT